VNTFLCELLFEAILKVYNEILFFQINLSLRPRCIICFRM